MEKEHKKTWTAPKLTVYGSVAELTKRLKKLGGSDGIVLVTDDNELNLGSA